MLVVQVRVLTRFSRALVCQLAAGSRTGTVVPDCSERARICAERADSYLGDRGLAHTESEAERSVQTSRLSIVSDTSALRACARIPHRDPPKRLMRNGRGPPPLSARRIFQAG